MSGQQAILPDQGITSRMVALTKSQVDVATQESTTSTSYTNLSTTGPAITLSPGVTQDHMLVLYTTSGNTTAGSECYMSPAIAGGAASDSDASVCATANFGASEKIVLASAQTSGATHTPKYRASANSAVYKQRRTEGEPR